MTAGTHDRPEDGCSRSTRSGRYNRLKTSHPKKNIIARDSNGGIARVCTASDGHVAHSGIAKAPTQVQVLGESGRFLIESGLSDPNHSVVLDMSLDSLSCKRLSALAWVCSVVC